MLGDVSGKGVPAALFMAVSKTLLKSHAVDGLPPKEVLTLVNHELCKDNDAMMFVTLFFGKLNIKTGQLTYVNAGHNPPYLRRAGDGIEELNQKHGIILGVDDYSTI